MKLRNQDSRFLKSSTKAMTGEATMESRRDGGGPSPVGAGKKSRVDLAGASNGVRRRYLLTLH